MSSNLTFGTTVSRSVDAYFEGKPESHAVFRIVVNTIAALGPVEVTVASQISFGRTRKFAWFWLYNVTQKDPDGVPRPMLAWTAGSRATTCEA